VARDIRICGEAPLSEVLVPTTADISSWLRMPPPPRPGGRQKCLRTSRSPATHLTGMRLNGAPALACSQPPKEAAEFSPGRREASPGFPTSYTTSPRTGATEVSRGGAVPQPPNHQIKCHEPLALHENMHPWPKTVLYSSWEGVLDIIVESSSVQKSEQGTHKIQEKLPFFLYLRSGVWSL